MTSARAVVDEIRKRREIYVRAGGADNGWVRDIDKLLSVLDAFAAEAVREFYDSLKESVRRHAEHCLCNACEFLRARHAGEGKRGCSCPPPYHHPACPMRPTP